MALGRSNSLSLNTTAANNSFASQQHLQPPPAGGPFGGSLFGNQNQAAKPATTTSLFGGQPATQTGGGLFGSQPASQPTQTTGLFGAQPTTQPTQSTGLFGGTTNQNTGSTSLFGGNQQPPASGNSLFGGSLFGQNMAKTGQAGTSLFGASQPAPAGTSLFGQTQAQPQPAAQQQPSLLGASRYTAGQPAPFTGRLTMGQGTAAQPSVTPATKLDWSNVRPTTRYSDLVDPVKEQLEQVDKMIQQQEAFSKQIEAFLPVHHDSLNSLEPDIELIKDKVDAAEQALISDAQGIQHAKSLTQKDGQDVLRCERIGENLRLPAQYHYAPAANKYVGRKNPGQGDSALDEEYDMNLVSNYFVPMATDMQRLLESYTSNLSEIEAHMSTIEATAIAQAQALNQQRTGGNGPDAVRQLADTLRGFESTILATAAKVGAAREGVTDLSVGRSRLR